MVSDEIETREEQVILPKITEKSWRRGRNSWLHGSSTQFLPAYINC